MTRLPNSIISYLSTLHTFFKVVIVFLFFTASFFFAKNVLSKSSMTSDVIVRNNSEASDQTLFPIQCIDTMKISRDKAKEMEKSQNRDSIIQRQIEKVVSLGANCVAIATPYNDEFVPVLSAWVKEARTNHLRVWFRGNFAEWEGWFGYKKDSSIQNHNAKTYQFIISHASLFENGDIFTSTPEAENGGPFNPINTSAKTVLFRQFLISEQVTSKEAFAQIGKKVTTNWLSMSGGVAGSVLDSKTIDTIGNIVTLDHYVKDPQDMKAYITKFAGQNKTKIVLGEFGAPIPDINGLMTDSEQAAFLDRLLDTLYGQITHIEGVNYWTLTDSSTALFTSHGQEKGAAAILKKYYLPGVLSGRVTNSNGMPLPGIKLLIEDDTRTTTTDKKGNFSLIVPARKTVFIVSDTQEYIGKKFSVDFTPGQKVTADISLSPQNVLLFYRFKEILKRLEK